MMGSSAAGFLRIALTTIAFVSLIPTTRAQYDGRDSWPEAKCARYKAAYAQAIKRQGLEGLSEVFQQAHDAFLASGCLENRNVCPRSKQELDLANTLVILAMNQNMASTFLPFACRKPSDSKP